MQAGTGSLVAGTLGVLLLLWAVGALRRIRRLRHDVRRAFQALDDVLSEQHRWILQWCAARRTGLPSLEAGTRRLAASAAQAALVLQRLRRDPLDAAAMDSLHQARRALRAAWRAGAGQDGAPGPADASVRAGPPEGWVRLVHQEAPPAAAFNERVAAYNAAVSQFPVLLLAAALRRRRARTLDVLEPA